MCIYIHYVYIYYVDYVTSIIDATYIIYIYIYVIRIRMVGFYLRKSYYVAAYYVMLCVSALVVAISPMSLYRRLYCICFYMCSYIFKVNKTCC